MCGLVGFAGGELNYQLKDVMKDMLVFSSVRGPDSTGLAMIDIKKKDVDIVKAVGTPYDLFEQKKFDSTAVMYGNNIFMGHCRKATRGEVTKTNAHPFHHGNVVGVHNGTLLFSSDLPSPESFGTDSEKLFHSFDYAGVEETIKVANGAWALVWYDDDTETLNFLRNEERSLWFAYSKDMDKIFWASEWWMIQAAVGRDGRKIELAKDKKGYEFFPFEDNLWYRFKVPTEKGKELVPLDLIEVKGNLPKSQHHPFPMYRTPWEWEDDLNDEYPHTVITGPGKRGNGRNPPPKALPAPTQTPAGSTPSDTHIPNSQTSGKNTPSPPVCMDNSQANSRRNISGRSKPSVLANGNIQGFNDVELSPEEWRLRTLYGCNFCKTAVTPDTVARWLASDMLLCNTCYPEGRAHEADIIPIWVNAE